ncbi:hypothetical protein HPP92_005563 [Vanilla planifolia]|uniref:Uncharacterized protein n=1 Tax=Vanilla planifolia TaxID=51239 RepID=A0A835RMY0_VANPL|nr:hypothetical protein HPP92_005563 [Vanilla planifolia]
MASIPCSIQLYTLPNCVTIESSASPCPMDRIASSFRALTRRFCRIRTKVAPDTADKEQETTVTPTASSFS